MGIRNISVSAIAMTTVVAFATTADAGFDLTIESGLGSTLFSETSDADAGTLNATPQTLSNGIVIDSFTGEWRSFLPGSGGGGSPDGVFVSMDFAITNNSNVDQVLVMSATSSILNPFLAGVLINGSIGFETQGDLLSFGNGAGTVLQDGSTPFYTALVDGLEARTLVDTFAPAPFLSSDTEQFGVPVKENGPAQALNDIGLDIQFIIPAGANLSLTATFNIVPVPAPAGLALLGVAGLATRRRRRNG